MFSHKCSGFITLAKDVLPTLDNMLMNEDFVFPFLNSCMNLQSFTISSGTKESRTYLQEGMANNSSRFL